jgi:hypothetical protein
MYVLVVEKRCFNVDYAVNSLALAVVQTSILVQSRWYWPGCGLMLAMTVQFSNHGDHFNLKVQAISSTTCTQVETTFSFADSVEFDPNALH